MTRLAVPKTYKLYIGGTFPRSESGRTYEVLVGEGRVPRERRQGLPQGRPGCRRRRPRAPSSGWSGATGVQPRPGALPHRRAARGPSRPVRRRDRRSPRASSAAAATAQVDEAIDRWVWYAGWADKYVQVAGNGNPVAGPYFNISVPEPTGVVAIVAPQDSSLLGLVERRRAGAGRGQHGRRGRRARRCRSARSASREVLATSDVPGRRRQHPHRLARRDRAVARQPRRRERARPGRRGRRSTGSTCRSRPPTRSSACSRPEPGVPAPSLERILCFTETKTVWHTKALI